MPIPLSQVSSFAGGQVHWTTAGAPKGFCCGFFFLVGGGFLTIGFP